MKQIIEITDKDSINVTYRDGDRTAVARIKAKRLKELIIEEADEIVTKPSCDGSPCAIMAFCECDPINENMKYEGMFFEHYEKPPSPDDLIVGTKIRIGEKYASEYGFKPNEVIELVVGYFEIDNGLYTTTEECPSVWDETRNEFDSIHHLFGNELELFMDCEVIKDQVKDL